MTRPEMEFRRLSARGKNTLKTISLTSMQVMWLRMLLESAMNSDSSGKASYAAILRKLGKS